MNKVLLRINTFFHALLPLVYSIFFISYSAKFSIKLQEKNDQAFPIAI